jgi:hypothetical protein
MLCTFPFPLHVNCPGETRLRYLGVYGKVLSNKLMTIMLLRWSIHLGQATSSSVSA